jgi:hypothetical protein
VTFVTFGLRSGTIRHPRQLRLTRTEQAKTPADRLELGKGEGNVA